MRENETRKQIIDKRLQEAGWNLSDRSQVVTGSRFECTLVAKIKHFG